MVDTFEAWKAAVKDEAESLRRVYPWLDYLGLKRLQAFDALNWAACFSISAEECRIAVENLPVADREIIGDHATLAIRRLLIIAKKEES